MHVVLWYFHDMGVLCCSQFSQESPGQVPFLSRVVIFSACLTVSHNEAGVHIHTHTHTHTHTHVSATTVPASEKKQVQKITPNAAVSYVAILFRIFGVLSFCLNRPRERLSGHICRVL